MSTLIGYPDFQAPRDYLAGLAHQQIAARVNRVVAGTSTVYTIPAGNQIIIRTVVLFVWCQITTAGVNDEADVQVQASKGFLGSTAAQTFAEVYSWTRGAGNAQQLLVVTTPIAVQTSGTNNLIEMVLNVGAGVAQAFSYCRIYGVQV